MRLMAIYLSKHYSVVASDLSRGMIKVAKSRARKEHVKLKFHVGDMRSTNLGKFDAVITIYNSIGHLSENGFNRALKNIRSNLKNKGIYIFDILNAERMKLGKSIKHKFIDLATERKGTKIVRFYRFKMDPRRNVFKIEEEIWLQRGLEKPKVIDEKWDMKIYSLDMLKSLLNKNNFKILSVYGDWGSKFNKIKSDSIVIVAQKQ